MHVKKILLYTATTLIFAILIGTPLFYLRQGVYPYIFSKTLFFQFLVEILFVVWLVLAIFEPRYRPKKTPIVAGGAVFLGVLILTSLFGVDPYRSFWSTYERMLGIFTILHLAAFALVISSLYREIPWKKILFASLATAAFVSILALFQKKIPNLLMVEPGIIGRPGSTFGNPTFLAGYLSFNIFIGLYLFLDIFHISDGTHNAGRTKSNILYASSKAIVVLALALLCLTALFLSETRGDILGLGVGLLALLCIFAFRPPEISGVLSSRRLYAGLLLSLCLAGSFFWFTRQNNFWEGVPGLNRFRDVSVSISESNTSLLPRLIALRAAWSGFLERPILGWGWENFNVPYNKYYDPRALELNYQETRFDKPHNFVLEDLVSGGLPLLLARIVFFALFVFEALKTRSLFGRFAVAALAAFVARDLFIFDTIGPTLMFYGLLGMVDGEYRLYAQAETRPVPHLDKLDSKKNSLSPYALILVGAGIVMAYLLNVPSVEAVYHEFFGFKRFHSNPTQAIADFDKALAKWSPYRWNFVRDFAAAVSEAYFYNPGVIKKEDAIRAVREMEAVAREHSADAYNHYSLVDMYNQISDIDPESFLAAADREAKIALELSPRRQEIYFSMAKTKSLRGDYKGALAILKEALDLDPKVSDAHFYYGLLLSANKDFAGGYMELKKAISLGKQWKNYYEPRTVADYFAQAGHTDEAIELYRVAVQMAPDDLETMLEFGDFLADLGPGHIHEAIDIYNAALSGHPGNLEVELKLGIAYFYTGDYVSSRKYLSDIAARFDFTKSPSYASLKPILDQLGIKVESK